MSATYDALPWWLKILALFILAAVLLSFDPRAAVIGTYSVLLLALFKIWS